MTAGKIPEEISVRVRVAAGNRCGYCLTYQRYAMQVLEIEHIISARTLARVLTRGRGTAMAFFTLLLVGSI